MHSFVRRPNLLRAGAGISVAALALLGVAACSDDEADPSGSGSTSSAESTSPEASTPETTSAETTTSAPADDVVEVEVEVLGGDVTASADRVPVGIGQTVRITVTSDVDDEVHVHGYEAEAELPAGETVTFDVVIGPDPGPGLYEVETHESGLLLFQLEVR